MVTQEVTIKPNLKIILKSDTQQLDEVMVVAYGTAKKSAFTGSASTIKAEKLAERQVSNVTNALSGQVAGVQTTSSNGQPGETANVRIRGIGSISASNKPLYVVDGVPFDGDLSSINNQDIESLTILKDAASNALYGARGANGVVLITTKKGATGKATINVDAKWGTNRRGVPSYNVMTDPGMYVETYYNALLNGYAGGDPNKMVTDKNSGKQMTGNALANLYLFNGKNLSYPIYSIPNGESYIGMDGRLNPNATLGSVYGDYYVRPDNWEKELLDNGNLRQEYNMNISGTTDKMNYYMSAGYLDDSGIIPGSAFARISTRLKADYQVNGWLKVGANVSYANVKSQYPDSQTASSSGSSANLFYITNNIAPIYPLYVRNADGSIKIDSRGYTVYDYGNGTFSRTLNGKTESLSRPFLSNSSPASALQLDKREFLMDIMNGRAFAEVTFIDGLKATANWGMDLDNTRYTNLTNPFYGQYSGSYGGSIVMQQARTFSVNQQYLLTYKKVFGSHNIDLLAGFESYNYKSQYLQGNKNKLYNPNIGEVSNAIEKPATYSGTTNYATEGILLRGQYDYESKYYFSASYRRDASSRFHPDNRWGNFWSLGAGWLMNKENFLKDVSWIDLLKFKISYGVQGNDDIGNYYAYMDQYSVANNNGDFSLTQTYKGNKNITWETSHSFNTGFDFEFFNGRLNGTVEYFSRKTTDMLYNKPVNPSAGYSSLPMNIGSMINKGVELDVNGDVIKTNNITWNVNFNLTHFKNKILKLHPDLDGEMISGSYIYREGESMYQFYLRKYAGVDKETGQALYYKDITDKDGNVTGQETTMNAPDATRYATGDILPKVYGGFGTRLSAYGFDCSIAFSYQLGGRVYDNGYSALMHGGGDPGQNWHMDILNAWSKDNVNSNIPRINVLDNYTNYLSDRFLTNSNYLAINNITFGYTLPKNWTNRLFINSMRLYMAADNVALFSKRKGFDPRQSYTTSSADTYSPIRSISGGISLSF